MKIAETPGVRVEIVSDRGCVSKVALSLDESFTCLIEEDLPHLVAWLKAYAERKPLPIPPFSLDHLSSFQKNVLAQMGTIPFGATTSYRELAKQSGNEKACRAVGGACNRNPFPLFYPCHRVIQSSGKMGGFALDLEIKERLLTFETLLS